MFNQCLTQNALKYFSPGCCHILQDGLLHETNFDRYKCARFRPGPCSVEILWLSHCSIITPKAKASVCCSLLKCILYIKRLKFYISTCYNCISAPSSLLAFAYFFLQHKVVSYTVLTHYPLLLSNKLLVAY